ncbi:uncharacterized protein LOC111358980 [Spodoptera litura]|uniref:Uncharacterized protein LOC111358980 n=1 Tax=Spodoptera litura TaxID=69820 RepID=A0A9J7ELS6_SPOLT|nr:uncharacterized protein LOC111358980 [Spodoptera litura]
MLFVYFITAISYIHSSTCVVLKRGKPLPQAEALDELLTKFLGHSYSDNTVANIILGKPVGNPNIDPNSENLDMNVLDVYSVKKIISFAKQKNEERTIAELTRRHNTFRRHKDFLDTNPNNTYITNKAMDLLQQSIYTTQIRMNVTYPFRKKYHQIPSYQISVLYGRATAIIAKMENLLAQMKTFKWKTHFIWHLIIYEKLLACNIDITNIVERAHLLNYEYFKTKPEKPRSVDTDPNSGPPSDFDESEMQPVNPKAG